MKQRHWSIDDVSLPVVPRLLNLCGNTLERFGIAPKPLDAQALRREAESATGLVDRGAATRFDGMLEQLLESARTEVRLSPFGRAFLRQDCVAVLSSQLLLEELFRQHPAARQLPVRRPLFLVGFFRSGTTLLQRILGNNPNARSLRFWESLRPVSEEFSRAGVKQDSRVQAAERDIRTIRKFILPQVHSFEARAPEEDLFLLRHMFSSLIQWCQFAGESYRRRLLEQDARPTYEYLRSLLQALQWQTPGGPWILKTGQHLYNLDVIAEVFPDAGFVWTHRDPRELVPSFLSTATCIRLGAHARPVDLPRFAEAALDMIDVALARAMQSEVVRQGDRIMHLSYSRLVEDPVAVATEICERFDLAPDDDFEKRTRNWLMANGQHRQGRHIYGLEPFGLDPDQIRGRYAEYTSWLADIGTAQPADSIASRL